MRKTRKVKKKVTKLKRSSASRNRLSSKDLNSFRKILCELKEDINDQIKHIYDNTLKKSQKEASGDISGYALHMADVATDTYDREFSLGLAANDRELLYEIDDAMKKTEDGTFGICES